LADNTHFCIAVFDKDLGEQVYRNEIDADEISIGSSADCDVRLKGVARMSLSRLSVSEIALSIGGKTKQLSVPGTQSLRGGWTLFVELGRNESELNVRFEGSLQSSPSNVAAAPSKRPVLSKRLAWSMLLCFIISIPFWVPDFSVVPENSPSTKNLSSQGSVLARSHSELSLSGLLEGTLSPGPLHRAHANATAECKDCHQDQFSAIQIEPCLACHTMKRHLTEAQTGTHPLCVTCHKEHEDPSILIVKDERLCLQCHAEHDTLKGVLAKGVAVDLDVITGFPQTHPDFDLAKQSDNAASRLSFSHKTHLLNDDVKLANNDQLLGCVDCHKPDERGDGFVPVTMTEQCSQCHLKPETSLNGSADKLAHIEHGDMVSLFTHFQDENKDLALHKLEAFAKQQCETCHALPAGTFDSTQQLYDWQEQQSFSRPIFEKVRFSHKKHEGNLECMDCHKSAQESEFSADNLLPEIEACGTCHQSEPEHDKVIETRCADCHYFHTIDWD